MLKNHALEFCVNLQNLEGDMLRRLDARTRRDARFEPAYAIEG